MSPNQGYKHKERVTSLYIIQDLYEMKLDSTFKCLDHAVNTEQMI